MEKQIILYTLPLEDFQALIRNCVKAELLNFTPPTQQPEELLTTEQTRKFLSVSKVTLSKWRKEGLINYKRIGTRIRFLRSDVMQAMEIRKKYGRGK